MMDSTLIYYLPSDDGQHLRRYEMKTAARDNTPVEALREMVRADKRLDSPLLPDGLSVNYVVVEHGTAFADFSSELSQLDTSPSVQELFIHMTTQTLTEFADIHSVVIQINGQPKMNRSPGLPK
ncbi:GerMN domain-containing protein [Allisonella histaminiformans]|uniref:GerMN domain-containing protein n=1 Tax=Allisonella histaminiformans TaxID=209880 RepID=UPI00240933AF|nr:GerMN domain-containing protein [Allisonella histaminiformans]MDD6870079.1 GerMN domain-containing protein [Allisonella histaminiformans]